VQSTTWLTTNQNSCFMFSQAAFFKELIPLKKKKEILEAMCLDIFIT